MGCGKAERNQKTHGITFDEASTAFYEDNAKRSGHAGRV